MHLRAATRRHWTRGVGVACLLAGFAAMGGCTDGSLGEVLRVDGVFGEPGISPGQYSYPRCIDADGQHAWIIDKMARVQKIDVQTGECLGGWRMPDWLNGKPTGVTVWTPPAGGATRIIIPDTHYHRVLVYDPAGAAPPERMHEAEGTPVARFGSFGEGDGQFIYPTDVCVLPTEDGRGIARLYVTEYGGNDRVSVYEPAFGETPGLESRFVFRFAFGSPGRGEGRLNRPQSILLHAERGELLVMDACNHRLVRFGVDGTYLGEIGAGIGRGVGQMKYPYGAALLRDGTVLVSEFGGNRLQRFDLASGRSLGIYGRGGRSRGELASPWGIALSGGYVLVLDSGNNRVQRVPAPGRSLWSAAGGAW